MEGGRNDCNSDSSLPAVIASAIALKIVTLLIDHLISDWQQIKSIHELEIEMR